MDFGPLDISTATWALGTATSWRMIDVPGAKCDVGSFQLGRLFVSVDAGTVGTEFSLWLALASADRATLYGLTEVECVILAGRKTAGTAGDYVCSVSIKNREVFDMLGQVDHQSEAQRLAWFVGCPDGLPSTATHVYVRGQMTTRV